MTLLLGAIYEAIADHNTFSAIYTYRHGVICVDHKNGRSDIYHENDRITIGTTNFDGHFTKHIPVNHPNLLDQIIQAMINP